MCVHVDFFDPGDTLTAKRHCHTLEKLRQAIRHKRPGLLPVAYREGGFGVFKPLEISKISAESSIA